MLRQIILCLCLGLMSSSPALELLHDTPARSHVTHGLHGVVSAQEQRASQVGIQILQVGGNAVDAAVASAFALMVTLPRAGSLGGGGFAMLALQADQYQPRFIDFREIAPGRASPAMMLNSQGEIDSDLIRRSWLSVGVPGNVAGLCYLENHFGKLSLARVMRPAITMAQEGFVVKPYLANTLHHYRPMLIQNKATQKMLSHADGREYQFGDIMRRPDLARSLQLIAEQGSDVFYKGQLAEALVASSDQGGGILCLEDLAHYQVIERRPIQGVVGHALIYAAPPPSSGGIALIQTLKILQLLNIGANGTLQNTALSFHTMAEVFNRVFLDRNRYIADPNFVNIPTGELLSPAYLHKLAKNLNAHQHVQSKYLTEKKPGFTEGKNTTHLSVVDHNGSMVALTYSINDSYGSGITVPGTGILLNNTMLDFTLKPPVKGEVSAVLGIRNVIEPYKRPLSSMTPIIVFNRSKVPWLASGSPGGPKIITTVSQLLINLMLYNMPLSEAVQAPRIHTQLFPDVLLVESGISPDTIHLLSKMGHDVQLSRSMGSLQSVMHTPDGLVGFSDTRRAGAGVATY